MAASGDFKLSISKALTDQLREHLAELSPGSLTGGNLKDLERRPGVYQLYVGEELVYVGSAAQSLPKRLHQHMRKIAGRQNISIHEVGFTCLYVDEDLTVLAPEDRLMKTFRDEGASPWNFNGFGNNDPGKRRDTTEFPPHHFDCLYPIRLDWECSGIKSGTRTAAELLKELKKQLPFLLRYERGKKAAKVYKATKVAVPSDAMSAEELLRLLVSALPKVQFTALPGYVIAYRARRHYPSGRVIKA